MNVKEAIDVLERNCDFHYEETDKCYGCKFENNGLCDEDFHDSLLALLKGQEAVVRCKDCKHSEEWYGDKRRCFLWHESGIDVFEDGFCNYGKRK